MVKEKAKRLAPTRETLIRLFAKSGNQCAFPDCNHKLFVGDTFVAQVCHIEAALPKGERHNKNQTNEERRHESNLMPMCYEHHITTNNVDKYSVETLKEYKRIHEAQFTGIFTANDAQLDQVVNYLKSIKEDTSETLQIAKETRTDIKEMLSLLKGQSSQSTASGVETEVNSIMTLRNDNKPKAALQLLEKIKDERWETLTPLEKYKVLANIGICYLDLRDEENAAYNFINAVQYNDNNDRALSFAALGYAIHGNKRKAKEYIKKALLVNEHSPNAYVALILSFDKTVSFETILKKIPSEIRQTSEISYALSQAAKARGDTNNEITWKQVALEVTERSKADIKAALATTLLGSIDNPFKILTGQLDTEDTNKVRYAIALLSEAWDELKGTEKNITFSDILLNRGIAKKFLKDMAGAYEDINEAAKLSQDFFALRHLAIISFETGNEDKTIQLITQLEQMGDVDQKIEVALFKAEIFFKQEKHEDAQNVVLRLLQEHPQDKYAILAEQLLISSLISNSQIDQALKRCEDGIAHDPANLTYYLKICNIYELLGNKELANEYLEKGYEQVSDISSPADIHDLAVNFLNYKEPEKAVALLERITNPSVYSGLTKKLLRAYHQAGEDRKALELCEQLQAIYGPVDFLTELQAVIYEKILDIPNAIQTCEQYLNFYPDDQFILIRLGLIYSRANDQENVKRVVEQIKTIDTTLSPEIRFLLAKLFCSVGMFEAGLNLAYETRREFFDIGTIHSKYFGLLLEFNNHVPPISIQTVALNTVAKVQLKSGNIVAYIIEDRKDPNRGRNELSVADEISQKLIGKSIGDGVELEAVIKPTKAVVVDILDKYIFALRESMELLTGKFLDTKTLQVIPTDATGDIRKDLQPVLDNLDEHEDSENQLRQLYNDEKITIGFISSLKKQNPVKTWSIYVSQEKLGIYTIGSIYEYAEGVQKLEAGTGILLDLESILALASLDQLHLLAKIPNPKAVAQATVEEILAYIREMESFSSDGFMTIGKVGNQYVRQITTREDIEKDIEHYKKLHEWIKANLQILPCTAALNMNTLEKDKMDNLLGHCFFDSILTAKEQDYLFIAEENGLRSIAQHEYGVQGFSLFLFYTYLAEKKLIINEEFDELIIKLILLNYKNLFVNGSILFKAATYSRFAIRPPFTIAVNSLSISHFPEDRMVKTAVDFFYRLYADSSIITYSENAIDTVKANLVLMTLSSLLTYREQEVIYHKLMAIIRIRFRLLQPQKDNLMGIINDYFNI